MTLEQRDAIFAAESPDPEEGGGGGGGGVGAGGESDSDEDLRENENDDVVMPETNDADDDDPEEEDLNSPSTSSLAIVPVVTTATAVVTGTATTSPTAAVTVAVPSGSGVSVAAIPVDSDPKWQRITEIVQQRPPQLDDSRRLFQRLWTDEDEIELLRGFLEYMTSHKGSSSHPPDTAPFYEQIKSKLQLDFNKNQLVEKLRRLKKKFRNVMGKISSGKEVFFKSPHDQATFEISRKIWNHSGKIIGFEDNNVLDFDETNTNHHHYHHHVNNTNSNSNFNPSATPNAEIESENGVEKKVTPTSNNSSGTRKRSRSRLGKIEEEKPVLLCDGLPASAANNVNNSENAAGGGGNLAGMIEETVRSCVSPVIKEMMNGTTAMMMATMGGFPGGGASGLSILSPMAMPSNLGIGGTQGFGGGGGGKAAVDERWRKQRILELEVYLRRLELVQDQIRAALHELKTIPGGGGGG